MEGTADGADPELVEIRVIVGPPGGPRSVAIGSVGIAELLPTPYDRAAHRGRPGLRAVRSCGPRPGRCA